MDILQDSIQKNPFRDHCVPAFTKAKRDKLQLTSTETLWGGKVIRLEPNRLTTAWLMSENPMMLMAGSGFSATEVRDKTFALQQEAASHLKGNRKLPKVKVAEALSSLNPSSDQTKMIAGVLYSMKRIQTVCFDEEKKTAWTVPDDLRAWSGSLRTLWVDAPCARLLQFDSPLDVGAWISKRESEGWVMEWPVSEGTFEEIKQKMAEEFSHITVHGTDGKKPKKEDYAKALGRCEAIRHLADLSLSSSNVHTLE